jgi:hypothetical protein
MRVEQSRIKLIKTEFESKLLFDNQLISDVTPIDISDDFSKNIKSQYDKLPKDKVFVNEVEFNDSVVFWLNNGEICCSINAQINNIVKSDLLINMASAITEFGEPK